ncbi:MAG: enoyl-CoA hydratase/isomerase family protein [Oligoflexales bacterium]|nr:enoyl-CoA hydratase/isomerase family protein [Oligoflexales bacterium]
MSITLTINEKGIGIACIDLKDHSSNVINEQLNAGFESVLKQLKDNDDLAGVILTSAKKDFVVGGDIDKLFSLKTANEAIELVEKFKGYLRALETCGKPVVAAMNGTTLGGGMELALACHYRIAIDDEKARFGFPEVTLGLLPGAGGTQRLPRLIGLQNSAPMLLEGKRISAQEALAMGMIDALAKDSEEMLRIASTWIQKNPSPKQPWDRKEFSWPGDDPKSLKAQQMWAVAPSMINKKGWDNYPAPIYIAACLFEGSRVDFSTALKIESNYFGKCIESPVSKNMMTTFWYQLNDIKKGKYRPKAYAKFEFKKIGVIGAGMMGAGIAYVSAYAGMEVVLKDVDKAAAEKGKDYSRQILAARVAKGKMTSEQSEAILKRITATGDAKDFNGCEMVVEAVFEQRELKAKVTQEALEFMPADSVFASNTSTLPISGLAEAARKQENFIGLHFFSPVDKMQLVEVIKGKNTSEETIAKAYDYVQKINKIPILVNDSRGFYTSRVFQTYVMEGMKLLEEGVDPSVIETVSMQAGMPVGPLALADEVSLRLMAEIFATTQKDFAAEGKVMPEPAGMTVVMKLYKEFQRAGKKAGAGLYEYPKDGKKFLWPKLREIYPPSKQLLPISDIKDRILFVQAIEAERCLRENVVTNAGDANIGSIFGWGFAPFSGGVQQFIESYGREKFLARSEQLAKSYGERFSLK